MVLLAHWLQLFRLLHLMQTTRSLSRNTFKEGKVPDGLCYVDNFIDRSKCVGGDENGMNEVEIASI